MFTAITFAIFIVLTLVEHKFSDSMEVLSNIGGWAMFIMTILFVLLAFATMWGVQHGDSLPSAPESALEAFDVED